MISISTDYRAQIITILLLLLSIIVIRFICVFTEEAEPEEPEPASNAYGRRRSRAVLYQLSGHYKSDKPKTGKLKLNNVSFVCFSENNNVASYNNNIVLHPDIRWLAIARTSVPIHIVGTWHDWVCFAIHIALENITR